MSCTTVTETEEQFLTPELKQIEEIRAVSKSKTVSARDLQPIVWRNVAKFALLHLAGLVGLYQAIFYAKWATLLFTFVLFCVSQFGATGGAHRLWSHRSFKAHWPAKVILMYFNTFSFQNDIIEWARDHRCHHKWTDTDADPHNAQRGLFYSHIGWLMVKKHPEVIRRGKTLDISDLTNDPVLKFQRKYYLPMAIFNGFIFTTIVPWYFWGETAFNALYIAGFLRYVASLNVTFCVNSLAHFIGYKPYDLSISPTENIMTSITTMGEGGHNYHHTFPQDYRTSEFGRFANWTTILIDIFAALGWVYDRKTVSNEIIARQIAKHGPNFGHSH
uniref:Uncharacterized protein n=1 Tax=Plectus sambesii TaxID=2011161 RepID=A0A914W1K9_9BILA